MVEIERLLEEVQSRELWIFVWQAWRYSIAGALVIWLLLRPGNRWICADARPGLAASLGLGLFCWMWLWSSSRYTDDLPDPLEVGMIGGCWGISVILCMLALRWSEGRSALAWLLLILEVCWLALIGFGVIASRH
jgi:hypothetical protein